MGMSMDTSNFDVDELKHLALKAMRADREEDALRLIKAARAQAPEDSELFYLLAMVHSNLGMVDRAIGELTQVLAIAPELINCRFQLGLLHFTRREFEQSQAVWKPLIATLAQDDPLRLLATGLTCVGNHQLEEGIPFLERGISLSSNQPLNEEMARIVAECRRYLAEAGSMGIMSSREVKRPASTAEHVLLSGYNRQPRPN